MTSPTAPITTIERVTLWAGLCLGSAFTLACFFIGGDLGIAATEGAIAAPFVAIAILARLGTEFQWALVLSWLGSVALLFLLFFANLGLLLGTDPEHPNEFFAVGAIAISLAGFISVPLLSPLIRARIGRTLGLQLDSPVRHIALFLTVAMSLLLLAPSLSTGQAILIQMLQADPSTAEFQQSANLLGLAWTIPFSFVLVGFGITRSFHQSWIRLGLEWRGVLPLVAGLVAAVSLFAVVRLVSAPLTELFASLGIPTQGEEELEILFSLSTMTPLIAISISVYAGVGEELVCRGVLQPRVGVLLATCFFTAMHAWQYTLEGLVLVFIVGFCLALLRRRYGLWASITAHFTYDLILLLLSTG